MSKFIIDNNPDYLNSGVQFDSVLQNSNTEIPKKSKIVPLPKWAIENFTKSTLFRRSIKWVYVENHKKRRECFDALKKHALDSKRDYKLSFTLHHKKYSRVGIQLTLKKIESISPYDILYD